MATRSVSSSRFLVKSQPNSLSFSTASGSVVTVTSVAAQNSLPLVSVAMWIYPIQIGNSYRIFAKKTSNFDGYINFRVTSTNRLYLTSGWGTTAGQWFTDNDTLLLNQWNHVVMTYNLSSASNDPIFYINGVSKSVVNITRPVGTAPTDDTNLYIGNKSGASVGFSGNICNVQMYNKILSQSEVNNIYYRNITASGLVGYWKFTDGSGSTATDSTGNANGTITTATWSTNVPSQFTARSTAGGRFLSFPTEKALSFNGTGDNVTCPVTPLITGISCSYWVYINKILFGTNNIVCWSSNEGADGFFHLFTSTQSYIQVNNRFLDFNFSLIKSLTGSWFHVVFTHTQGAQKIYINTVQQDSDTGTMSTVGTQTLTIAKASRGNLEYANIIVKDFVFQNTTTPWTQSQINALYYNRTIPTGANVWYKFDNNVNDSSGNGNNGTLTGGTYTTNVPSQFTARSLT